MLVPGANLLSIATRVIQPQTMQHRAFVSRTVNLAGDAVPTYAAAVDFLGSLQPVSKRLYQELGLNLAKNYQTLYTSADVKIVARDRTGDLIVFGGIYYLCESDTNWRGVDGWRKILVVEVPAP